MGEKEEDKRSHGNRRANSATIHIANCAPVVALVACAVLAVLVPKLHNVPIMIPERDSLYHSESGAEDFSSASSPGWTGVDYNAYRENATVEAAVEAAVMGAFLADAASVGLQGYALKRYLHYS